MIMYSVLHHHRHGVSSDVVTCERVPTEAEVVEACNLDYEPDMNEEIEIIRLCDITRITHIP